MDPPASSLLGNVTVGKAGEEKTKYLPFGAINLKAVITVDPDRPTLVASKATKSWLPIIGWIKINDIIVSLTRALSRNRNQIVQSMLAMETTIASKGAH